MEGRIGNNAVDAASRKCLLLHEQNLLLARNSSPSFFFSLIFLRCLEDWSAWFQNSKGV
jgi:hypothetical protein